MDLRHVVVDGSNIATEGREAPSLAQLDEAVQAFIREFEPERLTVVVDATFPNRIARKERKVYEEAVVAGELITPPAGAIGRGDAFVLQIADRAGATVLSNDSFQEFHGLYDWLFDKGRLIGGKPVPHVGWVFMDRTPVRGPASRRAISAARRAKGDAPVDIAEAPSAKSRRKRSGRAAENVVTEAPASAEPTPPATSAPAKGETPPAYNEPGPFAAFVDQHPVGHEVEAVVERFGSHGAYLRCGSVRAYAPLKNLGTPAPRSAKEVLRVGETRSFVVAEIDPAHRGVDLALPRPGAKRPRKSAKKATKAKKSAKKASADKAAAKTPDKAAAKTPDKVAKKAKGRKKGGGQKKTTPKKSQ